MSFTSLRMIHGWFTDLPWSSGRDGTRIPESGTAAPTSHLELASESASLAVLDGAGPIGDSTGTTTTQPFITTGISRRAGRFITATLIIEGAADFVRTRGLARVDPGAAKFSTVRGEPPDLSREAHRRREDSPNHAVKAESAPAPSATTTMAGSLGVIRRAEAPVLAAEESEAEAVVAVDFMVVVAVNRTFCPGGLKIQNEEEAACGKAS